MQKYLDLLKELIDIPYIRMDRTGTGIRSVFMRQMRFDLGDGFPLLTTKKIHFKSVVHELLWFLQGADNIRYLNEHGVTIWDEWADSRGDLGPVYGVQWRSWEGPSGTRIDQIAGLVEEIRSQPHSRRLLVSAWNPADIASMALPPCHYAFQCYVADNRLSLSFQMRSVDVFLGLPFNIASYALLTHLLAEQTGLQPGELIWTGGDVHLYANHFEQAQEQIRRTPYALPSIEIKTGVSSIDAYTYEDITLRNYMSHPHIKGAVAV